MKLHDHIVALERATEPSNALNEATTDLLGLPPGPRMTESMDTAAAQIPPGWRIRDLADATETTRTRVILEKPETAVNRLANTVVGYGCNRATALLAAALRAKACDQGSPMPPSADFTHEQHAMVDARLQVA